MTELKLETLPRKYIKKTPLLSKASKCVINGLENYFFWHGKAVSNRPEACIFMCIVLTSICAIGLTSLQKEEKPFRLWMPHDSEVLRTFMWKKDNFPVKVRPHVVLFEADNILDKDVLLEILKVHNQVLELSSDGTLFRDVCAKVPKVAGFTIGRRKRSIVSNSRRKRQINWLSSYFRKDYCYLLETAEKQCVEKNILEIWGYSEENLRMKTQQEIYDDINKLNVSLLFSTNLDVTEFLAAIKRNSTGKIIGARATVIIFFTKVDYEAIAKGQGHIDEHGIGQPVDNLGYAWEGNFIDFFSNYTTKVKNLNLFFMTQSSFARISSSTVFNDAEYLVLGFFVVFIYVQVMLGKFNCIEQRPILSLAGMSCIGLSIIVSYGFCSACGVPFGPVNTVLPFLLLGLGIDDMFVIMQAWNTLSPEERKEPLTVRMGYAMKHAGVSITITSVTNIMAFAIGSTTVLPALRSFCLFAATGILAVYFFQATFFTAWFALDQKRLEEKRNGLLWCIKMDNHNVSKCSQRDLCQLFFENVFSKLLIKPVTKVFIIALTAGILCVSIWGVSNLKQEFNEIWFMPHESHFFKFRMKFSEYFPESGYGAEVLFANTSLYDELPKVITLGEELNANKYVSNVNSWADSYKTFIESLGYSVYDPDVSKQQFYREFGEFFFSPKGLIFRDKNFKMHDPIDCLDPAPKVEAFSINFRFKWLDGTATKIKAMDEIDSLISNLNFSGYVRPYSVIYSSWETDRVIDIELYRNLGMAMCVVFLFTLILISSLRTSLMVLMCVLFTIIDVGAVMHWWGLTIDVASCIDLVLAIGLCVDYAAHIGHTFMTQRGTLDERMQETLRKIGPAVLNGGFSTFLAFAFLITSKSHVFQTFFKIFFSVSIFGLFHGLVFLPVLLSIFGPPSYEEPMLNNNQNLEEIETLYCGKLQSNCNFSEVPSIKQYSQQSQNNLDPEEKTILDGS